MTVSAFQVGVQSWHDFYLAVGSASAALLGLLFVGVSINLSAITAAERADLRTRANLAFSNLLYLLCISLVVLIPGADAPSLAVSFAAIASVGLLRIARRIIGLVRGADGSWRSLATFRRLSWTLVADLVLLFVAGSIAARGDAIPLYNATFVVFVLLIGAADVSWGLLVIESDDGRKVSGPADAERK
jgi:hypothetical protein